MHPASNGREKPEKMKIKVPQDKALNAAFKALVKLLDNGDWRKAEVKAERMKKRFNISKIVDHHIYLSWLDEDGAERHYNVALGRQTW